MKKNSNILFCVIYFNLLVSCNFHNLSGRPGEGYIIEVMIGTPRQKFNILVDTGSTNLAVAGALHPNIDRYFVKENSSSSENLHEEVLLLYTQGRWSGDLVSDVVYFPTLNWVPDVKCDIALITDSQGFYMNGSDWQGILGLAYPALARPSSSVRPWIDSLQRKSKDKTIAFSLTLCGPSKVGENKHYGSFEVLNNMLHPVNGLQTASVVREWFYEVIMTSVIVNGITVPVDCTALNTDKAIVDSGTTNIYLPKDVFNLFIKIIIDESFKANARSVEQALVAQKKLEKNRTVKDDEKSRLEARVLDNGFWFKQKAACYATPQDWDNMPSVSVELASTDSQFFRINLPGSSYVRQVFENDNPMYCYKFSIEPAETGSILGVVAMEGFQVVFNRTARTVGFLKSDCGPGVSIEGPFDYAKPQDDDRGLFAKCTHDEGVSISLLNIAAYIVCGVLLLASFMFAYLFGQWLKNKYFKYHVSGTAVSISHASLINEEA